MLGALPALGVAAPAFAQRAELQTPALDTDYRVDSWIDAYGRPTAKVTINGRGPFNFLVDTGSTTTVIAARHVAAWEATSRGNVTVNGATGSAVMPLAELGSLQAGAVEKKDLPVAVLSDQRLPREDGILGADVFAGRRLVFAIRDKTVLIEPSKRNTPTARPSNMRIRHGLLAEIEGRIGNIPTRLMLDTGAKSCIANRVLNTALKKQYPRQLRVDSASISGVTGHRVPGQLVFLPKLDMRVFTLHRGRCDDLRPVGSEQGAGNDRGGRSAVSAGVVLDRLRDAVFRCEAAGRNDRAECGSAWLIRIEYSGGYALT